MPVQEAARFQGQLQSATPRAAVMESSFVERFHRVLRIGVLLLA